jgi:C1A family cysteine protease
MGSVSGTFTYNGESWKKEFDLVDYAKMDLKHTWEDWRGHFGKKYLTIEEEYHRFGIFLQNLQQISLWNTNSDNTASLRPNQFTDLTTEEFVRRVNGANGRCFAGKKPKFTIGKGGVKKVDVSTNPASVDWTTKGVVTPVKNQGDCGSCWAFSATGSTECEYAIKNGVLNSLSEQQLVDCSDAEGNEGCNGGTMDAAFKYIEKEGGLCSETEYPYKGVDGSCKASSCGKLYNDITGYTNVPTDNEGDLETAAVSGCVSVAIQANQFAFQYYSSGILTGDCGTDLDHGVLVVGYGTQGSQEYWKVKNSWGTDWGEEGYVLICKACDKNGAAGECGINKEPSYPAAAAQ